MNKILILLALITAPPAFGASNFEVCELLASSSIRQVAWEWAKQLRAHSPKTIAEYLMALTSMKTPEPLREFLVEMHAASIERGDIAREMGKLTLLLSLRGHLPTVEARRLLDRDLTTYLNARPELFYGIAALASQGRAKNLLAAALGSHGGEGKAPFLESLFLAADRIEVYEKLEAELDILARINNALSVLENSKIHRRIEFDSDLKLGKQMKPAAQSFTERYSSEASLPEPAFNAKQLHFRMFQQRPDGPPAEITEAMAKHIHEAPAELFDFVAIPGLSIEMQAAPLTELLVATMPRDYSVTWLNHLQQRENYIEFSHKYQIATFFTGVRENPVTEYLSRLNALDPSYNYRLPTVEEYLYVLAEGRSRVRDAEMFSHEFEGYEPYIWLVTESQNPNFLNAARRKPNDFGIYDIAEYNNGTLVVDPETGNLVDMRVDFHGLISFQEPYTPLNSTAAKQGFSESPWDARSDIKRDVVIRIVRENKANR